jgi:hypothetical protein
MTAQRFRLQAEMSCTTKTTLVQVAVKALLKELIAAYADRRRERRAQAKCEPCERRQHEE